MNQVERERRDAANELIACIASCGRKFFAHEGWVAQMEVDPRGRVWFRDHYSRKCIYTHYDGRWRGFTGGGTLKGLVECLRNFIKQGTQIRRSFGPWPDWCCCDGDLWGYGDDMEIVRAKARELGIAAEEILEGGQP
jgi:hypothetical protein